MSKARSLKFKLYKLRAKWRKRRRLLFPSPAEVELIRIMGGRYITISWVVDPGTKFPLTIITDLGTIFKREMIEREIRIGAKYVDFGTVGLRYNKAIECDGLLWHQDITKEQERDEYLAEYGWQVLHVQAAEIYRNPQFVQQRILNYLAH